MSVSHENEYIFPIVEANPNYSQKAHNPWQLMTFEVGHSPGSFGKGNPKEFVYFVTDALLKIVHDPELQFRLALRNGMENTVMDSLGVIILMVMHFNFCKELEHLFNGGQIS